MCDEICDHIDLADIVSGKRTITFRAHDPDQKALAELLCEVFDTHHDEVGVRVVKGDEISPSYSQSQPVVASPPEVRQVPPVIYPGRPNKIAFSLGCSWTHYQTAESLYEFMLNRAGGKVTRSLMSHILKERQVLPDPRMERLMDKGICAATGGKHCSGFIVSYLWELSVLTGLTYQELLSFSFRRQKANWMNLRYKYLDSFRVFKPVGNLGLGPRVEFALITKVVAYQPGMGPLSTYLYHTVTELGLGLDDVFVARSDRDYSVATTFRTSIMNGLNMGSFLSLERIGHVFGIDITNMAFGVFEDKVLQLVRGDIERLRRFDSETQ